MLSLSRRALLAAASSLVLSQESALPLGAEIASGARGGRINLGLQSITFYRDFYAFLNVWKCGAPIQVVNNGITYSSEVPPSSANSAWGRFLDDDGELVTPLAAGTTRMERIFYSSPLDGLPDGYNRIGENWVLRWDGAASDVVIMPALSQVRVGNRIEWVWALNDGKERVVFSGIELDDPPRNVRLCEARHEARLDAGELFNPDWLASVREGSGIVRFMGWQNTNGDLVTLRFSDIPDEHYCTWGGTTATPFIKGGAPVQVMSALANAVESHPWICIPHAFGTKKLTPIANITRSSPAVVTSPQGHNWRNGEKALVYDVGGMTQLNNMVCTIADSDPEAGTLTLVGVDSTSFDAYKSSGFLASPFNLADIASEVALLASHFRDHIDAPLVTYFELSNETWNGLFKQSHWYRAQGEQRYGKGHHENRMSGYIAAHCMNVIRDAYGVKMRRKWKGVVATQTVNPNVTNHFLAGVKDYITEHDLPLMISDLFDDLAVDGYFATTFDDAQKSKIFHWMDVSEMRWQMGLEPTKHSYFNRIVNEESGHSIDKLVRDWRVQKIIADTEGLALVQYEGGNETRAAFSTPLTPEERTRYLEFYKRCTHTFEDAANYTAMFDRFIEIGGQYPAKFVEAGPVGYYGAWGGLRYLGDSNPVWDSVVKFNGRLK
jgi:hypothetical protein